MAKRESHLTAAQAKWMASIRASMQPETGRTLEQWVEIARTCPETKPRARQQWLKTHYGLGVNRASMILSEAFPSATSWDDPGPLQAALWSDPQSRAVFDALQDVACSMGEVTEGQRKGFTAWSRRVQFAAAKPAKDGAVLLGLAVPPGASPRLEPAGKDGWSERLTSRVRLSAPAEVDDDIRRLLRQAFDAA
jgi:hypothetical protein